MRSTILGIFCVFFILPVHSKDITTLLKEGYNRQSQLLIQSEIQKSLGNKANSPEVKKIVNNLLPWSQMEEFSPKQFSNAVILLYESEKAGIPFTSNEELLPLVATFTGNKEDFLYLSRFMRESEEANLPTLYRDELIHRGLDKRWDPLSVLVSGRLLILSRQENMDTQEYFNFLLKEMNPRFSKLSAKQSELLIQQLTKDFKNQQNLATIQKINQDNEVLKKTKGMSLADTLYKNSRSMDNIFMEYGRLELRKRPEINAEDIGIPSTNGNQSIQGIQPTPNVKPEPNIPSSVQGWESLNYSNLERVVKGWIGTRYKFGGNTKSGVDCSGFTLHVLIDRKIGVPKKIVPRTANAQARIGSNVPNQNMRAGDLVFFSASPNQRKITHVGLVMANRKFSHASSTRGVVIQDLDSRWWKPRFVKSIRIFKEVK